MYSGQSQPRCDKKSIHKRLVEVIAGWIVIVILKSSELPNGNSGLHGSRLRKTLMSATGRQLRG